MEGSCLPGVPVPTPQATATGHKATAGGTALTAIEKTELLTLSESWRTLATGIELRYGKTSPSTVKHCVATLEARAEEIEEFCRAHPINEPAPK
jgi:hypothetical protein